MSKDTRETLTYFDVMAICNVEGGTLPEPKASAELKIISEGLLKHSQNANFFVGMTIENGKAHYSDGTLYNLDYIRPDPNCAMCRYIVYSINWSQRIPYTFELFEHPRFKITPVCEKRADQGYDIVP